MTAARDDLPAASLPEPSTSRRATESDPRAASVTDITDLLAERRTLDEAKSLLMSRGNLTEPEAHRWIQKTAMDRRAPKRAIAIGIIEALSEKN